MSSLQDIYDQWQNNAEFRLQFKKNPQEALRNAKLELSPADFVKIKALVDHKDPGSESGELDGRISK